MSVEKKREFLRVSPAASSARAVVLRYATRAIWLNNDIDLKAHIVHMCDEIAQSFGKSRFDLSLDDVHSLFTRIHLLASKFRLNRIKASGVKNLALHLKSAHEKVDTAAYVYRIGNLVLSGNAFPMASKIALSIATPRLKRASTVYAAGILAAELYRNNASDQRVDLECTADPIEGKCFDPIFPLLSREHLRQLCELLRIRADINYSDDELRIAIENEFSYYTKNTFKHLYHKVSDERTPYLAMLQTTCTALKIDFKTSDQVSVLEERVVGLVLRETVDKLSSREQEELFERLSGWSGIKLDTAKIATGGSAAAYILANYAGFGTYLAASSALGALTSGLGITASFSVYTAMSSAISVTLGPVGLGVIATALLASLSKSAPGKAVPAIVYIAKLRAELESPPLPAATMLRRAKYAIYALLVISAIGVGYFIARMVEAG